METNVIYVNGPKLVQRRFEMMEIMTKHDKIDSNVTDSSNKGKESQRLQNLLSELKTSLEEGKKSVDLIKVVQECYGKDQLALFADLPDEAITMLANLLEGKLEKVNERVMAEFKSYLERQGLNDKLLQLEVSIETYIQERAARQEQDRRERETAMRHAATSEYLTKRGITVAEFVRYQTHILKEEEKQNLEAELNALKRQNEELETSIQRRSNEVNSIIKDLQNLKDGLSTVSQATKKPSP